MATLAEFPLGMWRKMGIVAGVVVALAGSLFSPAPVEYGEYRPFEYPSIHADELSGGPPPSRASGCMWCWVGCLPLVSMATDDRCTTPSRRCPAIGRRLASRAQLAARLAYRLPHGRGVIWIFLSLVGSDLLIAQLPIT